MDAPPDRPGNAPIYRGELYWVAGDESRGPAPPYAHPHVVVQDDVFNHARVTTVIVCALTSNLHRAGEPGNVLLAPGEGDLPAAIEIVTPSVTPVVLSGSISEWKSGLLTCARAAGAARAQIITIDARAMLNFFMKPPVGPSGGP